MSRRKGEPGPRAIDRAFPHQVAIPIPPGGLGSDLNTMHRWAQAQAGEGYRTRSLRGPQGGDAMLWCFRSAGDADAFRRAFLHSLSRP